MKTIQEEADNIVALGAHIAQLEATIANSDAAMANALERLETEKNRLIMERDNRITELEQEIAELRGHMRDTIAPALDQIRTADYIKRIDEQAKIIAGYSDHVLKLDKRLDEMRRLLEDSMKTMRLYINVPEFDDLRSRWEAIKNG